MLKSTVKRRSWITQRLANRYPLFSKARNFKQSVAQQVLQPLAREFEEVYNWSFYNSANTILNTSDLQQYQNIYKIHLDGSFVWQTHEEADEVIYLEPNLVRGKIDGAWINLSLAESNSLEDFWFGLPDRMSALDESFTYSHVLAPTSIQDLATAFIHTIQGPGRLWVTLSGNTRSLHYYGRMTVRSVVRLFGRDMYGRELQERVVFPYNGSLLTFHHWSDIDHIETEYIDESAQLTIDWLPFQGEIVDPFAIETRASSAERPRYFTLGTRAGGSTLKHLYFAAASMIEVHEGDDSKETAREMMLLDTTGSYLDVSSLTTWPKRKWLVATDNSNVYFFYPDSELPNYAVLREKSTEPILQVFCPGEERCVGDTVTLDYHLTRPYWNILRTRWSVTKPDGSIFCIAEDGSEVAFNDERWKTNEGSQFFNRTGIQRMEIKYLLDQDGVYIFRLESRIKDILSVNDGRFVEQTDLKIITAQTNQALTTVPAPPELTLVGVVRVLFDSYHNPWILTTDSKVTRVQFHYDRYLVDYNSRVIYVREPYTELEVEA